MGGNHGRKRRSKGQQRPPSAVLMRLREKLKARNGVLPESTASTPESPTTTTPTVSTPEPKASTPESPIITPEAKTSTPEPPASTPEPPSSTPGPTASTPEPKASTPESPSSTPGPKASIPEPPASIPESNTSIPESPASEPPPVPAPRPLRRPAVDTTLNPDSISNILHDCGGFLIQVNFLTTFRCRYLTKALIHFVAHNPPSVVANLFNADQVSNLNPHQVLSEDVPTRSRRNWQYVFAIINRIIRPHDRPPKWLHKEELLSVVNQKSFAVITGEYMSRYRCQNRIERYVSIVLGFWIAKLYSVSVYRANPKDLPKPLAKTYKMFLKWRGRNWATKVPCLHFEDDALWTKEELRSYFPFAYGYIPDESSRPKRLADFVKADDDELFVKMCDALGEFSLQTYCAALSFKGSLIDYYISVFKLEGEFDERFIPAKINCATSHLLRNVKKGWAEAAEEDAKEETSPSTPVGSPNSRSERVLNKAALLSGFGGLFGKNGQEGREWNIPYEMF